MTKGIIVKSKLIVQYLNWVTQKTAIALQKRKNTLMMFFYTQKSSQTVARSNFENYAAQSVG